VPENLWGFAGKRQGVLLHIALRFGAYCTVFSSKLA